MVLQAEDFISIMPDNVVTHILNRLPLQDAVRTAILSRNWRFKWTLLSHLVFDENFFNYLSITGRVSNCGKIINRLLLHLKGVITKFVLSIDQHAFSILDLEDIEHWFLFLSRNGIKDLTLWKRTGPPLKLPTHLFSCLELKHLKLMCCIFAPPASFHGFANLKSLELDLVMLNRSELGKFISRCPLLEGLNMCLQRPLVDKLNMYIFFKSNVKLVEIAKLVNLKMLSLSLYYLDNKKTRSCSSSIFELVGFLPKLEELDLDFTMCKFTEGGAKQRFPTTFPCLRSLKLSRIDLENGIELSCALEMIMSFPNLQTLDIFASDQDAERDVEPTHATCSPEIEHNTMGLLQLRSVVFTYSTTSRNEVCLIKYILACSPFLKKIVIHPGLFIVSDDKFMFARKLLKLHRASSVVDIDLH